MEIVLNKNIYKQYMAVINKEPINSYSYTGCPAPCSYTYTYMGDYYTKEDINSKINIINTKYNTLLSRYNKLSRDIEDINNRLDKLKEI